MNEVRRYLKSVLDSAKKPVHIKLIGDSITHGSGGTGFAQNGEPIVDGYARNPDGYCWANMFRSYMEAHYDCIVTNNACSGTKIEFVLQHFDTLVEEQDDLVICAIGTNNRNQYFVHGPKRSADEYLEEFYQNILKLHQRFLAAGKKVIFIANIPASAENEKDGVNYWRLFHMDDVCRSYEKASQICGFLLIPLYRLFLDYCTDNEIAVDSLLSDGLHPNDAGYDVIFMLIKKALLD